MNVRVVSQVSIKASLRQVRRYLADTRYHFLWNPHLQRIGTQAELKPGMRYETESMVLGVRTTGENSVVKLTADELEIENSTGMVRYRVNYHLLTEDDATLVICTTVVTTDSKAFAFARPVLARLARRELQSDLQALKIAVEQRLE